MQRLSSWRAGRFFKEIILIAFVLLFLGLPRAIALGRFVTADEPTWGKRAASFYLALNAGDYAATYQSAHPGVMTMWAGALAYHWKFPEYRRIGEIRLGDTKLLQLFERRGPLPMEVLAAARLFVVFFILMALAGSFYFARQLFGALPALLGMFLIAFDPFFLAHSRLLHIDAMLSSFMFLTLVAFLHYLHSRSLASLIVSGIATGLSLLTKTPGAILLPVMALLAILDFIYPRIKHEYRAALARAPSESGGHVSSEGFPAGNRGDENSSIGGKRSWRRRMIKKVVLPLAVWGTIALAVLFSLWPAMWVDPIGSLVKTASYSLDSAEGEVGGAQFVEAFRAEGDEQPGYLYFYPLTYLWRSTPVVLLGLAVVILVFWRKVAPLGEAHSRFAFLGLLAFTLIYLAVMSFGSKKFDRYFLPAYLPLDMLAGLGWSSAILGAGSNFTLRRRFTSLLLLGAFLAAGALGALRHYPYYLTYYNPLLGGIRRAQQVMMIGWGEGLEQAAIYLKEQPEVKDHLVMTWYALAFNWYGQTYKFTAEPIPFSSRSGGDVMDEYRKADYLVVYVNQWQRKLPSQLFEFLRTKSPEHTIWIDGIEYVRIYHLDGSSPGN